MPETAAARTDNEEENDSEETEAETEETAVTEAENDEDEELYGYYKLLDEAYENDKANRPFRKGSWRTNGYEGYLLDGNKIYYMASYGNGLCSYDIDAKEETLAFAQYDIPEMFYTGSGGLDYPLGFLGYYDGLYYFVDAGKIAAADSSGNVLYTADAHDYVEGDDWGIGFGLNGTIKYGIMTNYEHLTYESLLFSPDLKLLTNGPQEIIHGEAKPMSVYGYYRIEGKIYAEASDSLYLLDEETLEWVKVRDKPIYLRENSNVIGQYLFDSPKMTDVLTGEVIAECFHNTFFGSYFGGGGNIILNDGDWYKVRYPSDGSAPDFSKAEKLGHEGNETKGTITRLSDKYYVVKDKYGLFLRTYEKGDAEEAVIIKFD